MVAARAVAVRVAISCCLIASLARAQSPEHPADELFDSPFEIDHAKPEAKIPTEAQKNAAPLEFGNWLMEVTELAERASKQGDHLKAIGYFRALALAVPDSAAAFRRLCDSHEALEQRARALEYCAAALRREGVRVSDYVHYVHLVLKQPEALTPDQARDFEAIMTHLRTQQAEASVLTELECLLALKLQDVPRLESCTRELRHASPDGPLTIGYEWRLAIARLDRAAAERAVARAKQHGTSAATVRSMEEATKRLMHPVEKWVRHNLEAVAIGAALLLAVMASWFVLRRRRTPSRIRTWSFR